MCRLNRGSPKMLQSQKKFQTQKNDSQLCAGYFFSLLSNHLTVVWSELSVSSGSDNPDQR